MTEHRIIFGDSRSLNEIIDKSVQLIITSPPYWQLKDYGTEDQIGFNDSYEEYINNLNLVWQECYRVLSDGCRMCINIGDQFARSVYYGRYKVIPIRRQIFQTIERSRNVIMHSGELGRRDIERIGTNIRDWINQVG